MQQIGVPFLEIQYLDPPMPEGVLSLSVYYAPVVIKEETFWMPKTVTAEAQSRFVFSFG